MNLSETDQSLLLRWINRYRTDPKSENKKFRFVAEVIVRSGALLFQKDRNSLLNKFRTDVIAFEIAVYFYFLCDYWLHRHGEERREAISPLFQRFYLRLFSQIFADVNILQIVNNRLRLYGEAANQGLKDVTSDSFEIFVSIAVAGKESREPVFYKDLSEIQVSFEFDTDMLFRTVASKLVSQEMPQILRELKEVA